MELAALIISIASLLLLLVVFVVVLLAARKDGQSELRMELNNSLSAFGKTISDNQRSAAQSQDARLSSMEQNNALDFERLRKSQEDRIGSLERSNEEKLEAIRQTMGWSEEDYAARRGAVRRMKREKYSWDRAASILQEAFSEALKP